LAVFEVKDWNLEAMPRRWDRDPNGSQTLHRQNADGRWFRDQDPLAKIEFYRQQIIELYAPSMVEGQKWADAMRVVSAGLIFPNASREQLKTFFGPVLPGSRQSKYPDQNPLVAAEDLTSGSLDALFPLHKRRKSPGMTTTAARELRAWLLEPEHMRDQREPLPLDGRQRDLVDNRTQTGYQRIRGPAGSGKTHVLAVKAARLAGAGRKVLIVNYTITLLNFIRDLVVRGGRPASGLLRNVDLYNFHAWCKWVCLEYGYAAEYKALWAVAADDGEAREGVLNEELATLALRVSQEARDRGETKGVVYDAVLVDEAQDFRLSWWKVVASSVGQGGEKILCADVTQNLYGTAQVWTDEAMLGAGFRGRWAELKTSYRLPPQIVPYIRTYAEEFLPSKDRDLPEAQQIELGSEVRMRWRQVSQQDLVTAAADAICDMPVFAKSDDVAFADVVLLADRTDKGFEVVQLLGNRGVKVAHTFSSPGKSRRKGKRAFFMGAEKVKATTFHSFKGWEARYLVLCVSALSSAEDRVALYVALTRLKASSFGGSYLTVISAEPALATYGASWPS
jgi:superfamily I DNA/RNA helicase